MSAFMLSLCGICLVLVASAFFWILSLGEEEEHEEEMNEVEYIEPSTNNNTVIGEYTATVVAQTNKKQPNKNSIAKPREEDNMILSPQKTNVRTAKFETDFPQTNKKMPTSTNSSLNGSFAQYNQRNKGSSPISQRYLREQNLRERRKNITMQNKEEGEDDIGGLDLSEDEKIGDNFQRSNAGELLRSPGRE